MAGKKVLHFFLLISFVIFSTHALEVILTDGKGRNNSISGFKYETRINYHVESETSVYDDCVINKTYTTGPNTTKAIVYIKTKDAMSRTTFRSKCGAKRVKIAETLSEHGYEMLYMGVTNFTRSNQHLLAEFLLQSIKSNLPLFQINTIGEKSLNLNYRTLFHDLNKYEEEPGVFGGDLLGELRSMDK